VIQTSNDGRVAVDEAFAAEAIDAAEAGRSGVLRKLSWEHPNWIRLVSSMVNMEQGLTAATTCLHSAAAAGHAATVHSLVTEAACDILARNALGQFAWDVEANDPAVRDLLDRLQQTQPNTTPTNIKDHDHSSSLDGTDSRSTARPTLDTLNERENASNRASTLCSAFEGTWCTRWKEPSSPYFISCFLLESVVDDS
jgi:hypothetical protein